MRRHAGPQSLKAQLEEARDEAQRARAELQASSEEAKKALQVRACGRACGKQPCRRGVSLCPQRCTRTGALGFPLGALGGGGEMGIRGLGPCAATSEAGWPKTGP
jgi:hypothetical protein